MAFGGYCIAYLQLAQGGYLVEPRIIARVGFAAKSSSVFLPWFSFFLPIDSSRHTLDTRKPFPTVNNVPASNGSINGVLGGAAGNVLLAFSVDGG